MMTPKDPTLERALSRAGGVNRLAQTLGVRQNVVSNWRRRGLPWPWRQLLDLRYPQSAQETANG